MSWEEEEIYNKELEVARLKKELAIAEAELTLLKAKKEIWSS